MTYILTCERVTLVLWIIPFVIHRYVIISILWIVKLERRHSSKSITWKTTTTYTLPSHFRRRPDLDILIWCDNINRNMIIMSRLNLSLVQLLLLLLGWDLTEDWVRI
jgi:hypothetical protein